MYFMNWVLKHFASVDQIEEITSADLTKTYHFYHKRYKFYLH